MADSFTPGPWRVGGMGTAVFSCEGKRKIAAPGTDVPLSERAHNARLIAAAPLLLAACEALCDSSPLSALLPPEDAKPFSEAYAAARAAIAAARTA